VRRETLFCCKRCSHATSRPSFRAGLCWRSGDLAPLAHMAAAMIGVGEAIFEGVRMPADAALRAAGLCADRLGPKEGLALLNGTQFSTAHALAALFEAERLFQSALLSGACRPMRRAARMRRSTRASMTCAAIAGRSKRRRRCGA